MIYILSDSIGETASHVARAAAIQFKDVSYEVRKHNYLKTTQQIQGIIKEASQFNSFVIFTTVLEELRDEIILQCQAYNVKYHDVITPLLTDFQACFEVVPERTPGSMYQLDEQYFEKVEAIEFAVKYDDGKDLRGLRHADVVLLGISRTSKTPLSMYLAHKNIKVANVPLVPEIPIPEEVFDLPAGKVIGLTNSPKKLNEIRISRLKAMGLNENVDYASLDRILFELDFADRIYKKVGCPVINVASKAIEETANIIIEITGLTPRLK